MKQLYKFLWDCGRNGKIESLFIAEDIEVDQAIGRFVTFGDILGKHSNIGGLLDESDFTVIANDTFFILVLQLLFKNNTLCGYNPLDYLEDEE